MTDGRYEPLRLRNQVGFPIYLCAKEIARRYQPMLDALNLTYTQYVVMMYFWEVRRANVRDVSRALLLDPSTLTPILKKLDAKGYLTRMRDPADERSLIITLTESGEALQEAAISLPGRMGSCLGLTDGECAQLVSLINKALLNITKES